MLIDYIRRMNDADEVLNRARELQGQIYNYVTIVITGTMNCKAKPNPRSMICST
jgi:hypothetical protein